MARKKKSGFSTRDKFVAFVSLILLGFLLGVYKDRLNPPILSPFIKSQVLASETISPRQLKEKLEKKDFVFMNVHTPYEGEIPETDVFIEYDSIKANAERLPKDKNAAIIIYCKSGNMSAQALQTLKSMGYTNVKHLEGGMDAWRKEGFQLLDLSSLPSQVLPEAGFELPISWANYGSKLVELGVIDTSKFEKAVKMTDEQRKILAGGTDMPVKITSQNGQFVVDVLWALGLAQKSKVYEEGPLGKEYKEKVGNFASTGGWTLGKDSATSYLNKFELIPLSSQQQDRVAEISKNVFRPCCGNPTWFPDCNHGMAALAAIELMVSEDLPDEEIYKNVLKLNSFWFPDHYLTVATYFARQGISWDKVDAKLVLGDEYSSARGAQKLFQKVGPLPYAGSKGGSCGA